MQVWQRVGVSILLWMVLTLVVAATVELNTGRRQPAITHQVTLVLLAPCLWFVWRRRRQ